MTVLPSLQETLSDAHTDLSAARRAVTVCQGKFNDARSALEAYCAGHNVPLPRPASELFSIEDARALGPGVLSGSTAPAFVFDFDVASEPTYDLRIAPQFTLLQAKPILQGIVSSLNAIAGLHASADPLINGNMSNTSSDLMSTSLSRSKQLSSYADAVQTHELLCLGSYVRLHEGFLEPIAIGLMPASLLETFAVAAHQLCVAIDQICTSRDTAGEDAAVAGLVRESHELRLAVSLAHANIASAAIKLNLPAVSAGPSVPSPMGTLVACSAADSCAADSPAAGATLESLSKVYASVPSATGATTHALAPALASPPLPVSAIAHALDTPALPVSLAASQTDCMSHVRATASWVDVLLPEPEEIKNTLDCAATFLRHAQNADKYLPIGPSPSDSISDALKRAQHGSEQSALKSLVDTAYIFGDRAYEDVPQHESSLKGMAKWCFEKRRILMHTASTRPGSRASARRRFVQTIASQALALFSANAALLDAAGAVGVPKRARKADGQAASAEHGPRESLRALACRTYKCAARARAAVDAQIGQDPTDSFAYAISLSGNPLTNTACKAWKRQEVAAACAAATNARLALEAALDPGLTPLEAMDQLHLSIHVRKLTLAKVSANFFSALPLVFDSMSSRSRCGIAWLSRKVSICAAMVDEVCTFNTRNNKIFAAFPVPHADHALVVCADANNGADRAPVARDSTCAGPGSSEPSLLQRRSAHIASDAGQPVVASKVGGDLNRYASGPAPTAPSPPDSVPADAHVDALPALPLLYPDTPLIEAVQIVYASLWRVNFARDARRQFIGRFNGTSAMVAASVTALDAFVAAKKESLALQKALYTMLDCGLAMPTVPAGQHSLLASNKDQKIMSIVLSAVVVSLTDTEQLCARQRLVSALQDSITCELTCEAAEAQRGRSAARARGARKLVTVAASSPCPFVPHPRAPGAPPLPTMRAPTPAEQRRIYTRVRAYQNCHRATANVDFVCDATETGPVKEALEVERCLRSVSEQCALAALSDEFAALVMRPNGARLPDMSPQERAICLSDARVDLHRFIVHQFAPCDVLVPAAYVQLYVHVRHLRNAFDAEIAPFSAEFIASLSKASFDDLARETLNSIRQTRRSHVAYMAFHRGATASSVPVADHGWILHKLTEVRNARRSHCKSRRYALELSVAPDARTKPISMPAATSSPQKAIDKLAAFLERADMVSVSDRKGLVRLCQAVNVCETDASEFEMRSGPNETLSPTAPPRVEAAPAPAPGALAGTGAQTPQLSAQPVSVLPSTARTPTPPAPAPVSANAAPASIALEPAPFAAPFNVTFTETIRQTARAASIESQLRAASAAVASLSVIIRSAVAALAAAALSSQKRVLCEESIASARAKADECARHVGSLSLELAEIYLAVNGGEMGIEAVHAAPPMLLSQITQAVGVAAGRHCAVLDARTRCTNLRDSTPSRATSMPAAEANLTRCERELRDANAVAQNLRGQITVPAAGLEVSETLAQRLVAAFAAQSSAPAADAPVSLQMASATAALKPDVSPGEPPAHPPARVQASRVPVPASSAPGRAIVEIDMGSPIPPAAAAQPFALSAATSAPTFGLDAPRARASISARLAACASSADAAPPRAPATRPAPDPPAVPPTKPAPARSFANICASAQVSGGFGGAPAASGAPPSGSLGDIPARPVDGHSAQDSVSPQIRVSTAVRPATAAHVTAAVPASSDVWSAPSVSDVATITLEGNLGGKARSLESHFIATSGGISKAKAEVEALSTEQPSEQRDAALAAATKRLHVGRAAVPQIWSDISAVHVELNRSYASPAAIAAAAPDLLSAIAQNAHLLTNLMQKLVEARSQLRRRRALGTNVATEEAEVAKATELFEEMRDELHELRENLTNEFIEPRSKRSAT